MDVSRHVFENEHGATLIVQEVLSASENRKFVMRDGESTWPADTQLATEVLRLAAEVERLRAEREWRPIETAPKDGTEVLLWVAGARWIGRWAECYGEGSPQGWCLDGAMCANPPDAYDVNGDQPTHWMPLPPGPTDEVCG